MEKKMTFNYFYGTEADQFSFYRIPKRDSLKPILASDRFQRVSHSFVCIKGWGHTPFRPNCYAPSSAQ